LKAAEWIDGKLKIIDQTRLPGALVYLELEDFREVAEAISSLRVRGAPLIGVAAAYGLVLGVRPVPPGDTRQFLSHVDYVADFLAATRPTAVNLAWALKRMKQTARSISDVSKAKTALLEEAHHIAAEDEAGNRRLGRFGAELIGDGFTILTHCNAGSLATAGYGTAEGVMRAAVEQGKKIKVYATETRPLLQGARLTAWELMQDGIDVTLITDGMTGRFLSSGAINCVVVGADRITANGDVANKIGTYNIAVLAQESGVPFYVAAPTSTIDLSLPSGDMIPIEERSAEEVTHVQGVRIAPEGVKVANPSFDVTPHCYVTAIITEKGIVREPYLDRLAKL